MREVVGGPKGKTKSTCFGLMVRLWRAGEAARWGLWAVGTRDSWETDGSSSKMQALLGTMKLCCIPCVPGCSLGGGWPGTSSSWKYCVTLGKSWPFSGPAVAVGLRCLGPPLLVPLSCVFNRHFCSSRCLSLAACISFQIDFPS